MSLTLDRATVILGDRRWVFDTTLATHGVHALLGRSGSGKSTLLNLIGGYLQLSQGRIAWQERSLDELAPAERPVTTLFQHDNLFAHLSVAQNVGLGISPTLSLSRADRERVAGGLAEVGLAGYERRRPGTLSGGERQRVGLARCLLRARPVLLLDEPFGALDPATRREVIAVTREVIARQRPCVVMVTHDEDDATAIGADIIRLEDGRLIR